MKYGLLALIGCMVLLSACAPQAQVTSFEDCVAQGNPVMESYPRQCAANGQTFVEDVGPGTEQEMSAPAFSSCQEPRPEACTMQYDPVCALVDNGIRCVTEPCPSVDAVTMGNQCSACSDENVLGTYPGECQDITFAVCEEIVTGFNVTQLAQDAGWVCVDICPNNYDSYVTQIGAQLCIERYTEQEIEEWETCERSTDTCDCAKAYETTQNEPIANAEYRCVPEQYGSRLLFRSGLDRLDENGEQSVMIA